MAALGALGFAAISQPRGAHGCSNPGPVGLAKANEETNPTAIAKSIFTNHALAMEQPGRLPSWPLSVR